MSETAAPAGRPDGEVMVYLPDRGLGDLMWHLPTVRGIAALTPERRVTVVARPSSRAQDLLRCEPSVGRVLYLPYLAGRLRHLREVRDFHALMRRERPRAVWILEKIGRPALAAALAGVPERRGFGLGHAGQERWLSPGPVLPRSMRPDHRIAKLAAFERLYDLPVAGREPDLPIDPAAREAVLARFAEHPRPWLAIGTGASSPERLWPVQRSAALADELAGEGTVFLLGGPGEEAMAHAIAALATRARTVVSSDLPADLAAAFLAEATLFVGPDSGLMNLAAAVGTPTVGLFAPNRPLDYSRWLWPVKGERRTMDSISLEAVADTCRRALAERTLRA